MVTMQTYLLGIKTVTSLIERMGEWLRISHEQLIPTNTAQSPARHGRNTIISLPRIKRSVTSKLTGSFLGRSNLPEEDIALTKKLSLASPTDERSGALGYE